jgi:hypothetical protein
MLLMEEIGMLSNNASEKVNTEAVSSKYKIIYCANIVQIQDNIKTLYILLDTKYWNEYWIQKVQCVFIALFSLHCKCGGGHVYEPINVNIVP